jgi:hypothetical protein
MTFFLILKFFFQQITFFELSCLDARQRLKQLLIADIFYKAEVAKVSH